MINHNIGAVFFLYRRTGEGPLPSPSASRLLFPFNFEKVLIAHITHTYYRQKEIEEKGKYFTFVPWVLLVRSESRESLWRQDEVNNAGKQLRLTNEAPTWFSIHKASKLHKEKNSNQIRIGIKKPPTYIRENIEIEDKL